MARVLSERLWSRLLTLIERHAVTCHSGLRHRKRIWGRRTMLAAVDLMACAARPRRTAHDRVSIERIVAEEVAAGRPGRIPRGATSVI